MPGPSARALVVDDNAVNRELLATILASQGLTVDFAVNGEQAVVIAKAIAFDLILMDFQMPLMDGLTATALIRQEERQAAKPRTRLFIVSACGEEEVALRARFAGADGVIGTPLDFKRIVDLAQGAASPVAGRERTLDMTADRAPGEMRAACVS